MLTFDTHRLRGNSRQQDAAPLAATPCSPLLPDGAVLQFLEDGKWVDVATRARTREGMIRIYKAMCRKHPRGAPYGMRIITIHEHRLGRFLGTEWKTENSDYPTSG